MSMGTGLVLEGGAMRGMFTAGVIDVFMGQARRSAATSRAVSPAA